MKDNRIDIVQLLVLLAFVWIAGSVLLGLTSCGDNRQVVTLLDAPPDAGPDCAPPDPDAGATCCSLYPDEDAIRACAKTSLPPGSCGVLACPVPDACGEFLQVHVCNLMPDGGAP